MTAQTKVAPSKPVTVPRLELSATLLSVKIGNYLARELTYDDIRHVHWTDSKIVLSYINNDAKKFHIFVDNRIQEIHERLSPDD